VLNFVRDYLGRLNRSLAACECWLDRPRPARQAVTTVLLIHTLLLAYSGYVHSPTLNEPGHLVAGLSHWKFGSFDLYPNNPPLVRMVAALPVLLAGYVEDWSRFSDAPGAMSQFVIGEDFVAANGERSFFLFTISRWACIPFSWIGAVVCYLWARDLYGRSAGVLACAIWCFDPNVLANAALITPDVPATALGLAACYTFWRWLRHPTWGEVIRTGVVLGIAELTKTTLILFYPIWPLLWVAYRLIQTRSRLSIQTGKSAANDTDRLSLKDWWREAGMMALRMVICLYIVNLGYGFEGSMQKLGTFRFVSNRFTGSAEGLVVEIADENKHFDVPVVLPALHSDGKDRQNRFADSWMGVLLVPLPKNYVLGLDIQQRSFESYGHPSYLRGEWSNDGWWYYYLYALAIKIPLGLSVISVFALIFRIYSGLRTPPSLPGPAPLRDELLLVVPASLIFIVVSANTVINEHVRYALPCLPFLFVWISGFASRSLQTGKKILDSAPFTPENSPPLIMLSAFARAWLAVVLLLWSMTSSLWIYPHSLSYFNESIGGPLNGPKHLLGSGIDWGQDLRYLIWRSDKLEEEALQLAYFGFFNPQDAGVQFQIVPEGNGKWATENAGGDVAISVNFLYGRPWFVRFGNNSSHDYSLNALSEWRLRRPAAHIGYSIYMYSLPLGEAR
jgi:hypothetical protein